jgi:hypothetical protein
MNDDTTPNAAIVGDEIKLADLLDELTASLDASVAIRTQQARDFDTTFALWEGQTDDERQWEKHKGKNKAFPWEGASDARVFYADGLIAEQTRIGMAAFRRSRVQATALHSTEPEAAHQVQMLMQWLFYSHLRAETERETELALRYRQQYGAAIMHIGWDEQYRLVKKPIRLADLQAAAMQTLEKTGDRRMADTISTLTDPLMDEPALAFLQALSPLLKPKAAQRVLKELRTEGKSELPDMERISSLPKWRALRPFVDVFYPPASESCKTARWIAYRQFLNETQLRGMAITHGWDADFVEEAIKKGKGQTFDGTSRADIMKDVGKNVTRGPWMDNAENQHLIELVWFYHLATDEELEMPCLFLTVFCPAVTETPAFHGPSPDAHGHYPFVEFPRERVDGAFMESRGVPQVAKGWQGQLKKQRDAFVNRSDINTIPPLITTGSLGKTNIVIGPGVQHPERRSGEIRWMQIPQAASDAANVTAMTEREADRYFGRMSEHTPATATQLAVEDLAGGFLVQLTECFNLSLALAQQWLPETTVQRVVGNTARPFKVSREEIQGRFDLRLTFSASDLDFENTIKKLDAWNKFILSADHVGAMNVTAYLEMAARQLDPDMAALLISDQQSADAGQITAAKTAWAQMCNGVEPDMMPSGQNYALQLQALEQLMQNPLNQQRLQVPDTKLLFERYIAHLQFGMAQQENAQTGKVGVSPLNWQTDLKPALPAPGTSPQ